VKFFEDINKYYPFAAKLIQEEINRNNAFLCDFLRKGIEQGYIRSNLNVEVAAFLLEDSTYYLHPGLLPGTAPFLIPGSFLHHDDQLHQGDFDREGDPDH